MCLAAAMALAAIYSLWITRDQTFFSDEWSRYATYPDSSFTVSLHGASGHLILGNILLYRALLELFGADSYLPFRIVAAGLNLTCAWLFFAFARDRADPWLVGAAAILLLYLGAAWEVLATPYGIVILLPIACGLAALNSLRRSGLAWEIGACALLVVGVLSQSFALPFLAGAFVMLAIGKGRSLARSLWVVGVPLVLYAAWFLWSRTDMTTSFVEDPVRLGNLAQVPNTLVALCAVGISTITGTFRQQSFVGFDTAAGYALLAVLIVIGILRWQDPRWRPSPRIWVPVAMMLAYGALVGLALSGVRTPTNTRYIYLATLLVLLFLLEFSAGRSLSLWAIAAVGAVFVAGLTTNLITYNQAGRAIGQIGIENRAVLAALEVSGPAASPDFSPGSVVGPDPNGVTNSLGFYNVQYQEAARRFGSPAGSPESLPEQEASARQAADQVLINAEGLVLGATPGPLTVGPKATCSRLGPPGAPTSGVRRLRPGQTLNLRAIGAGAGIVVTARRFAPNYTSLGTIPATNAATITAPPDRSSVPWEILVSANQRASACIGKIHS